VTRAGLVLLLLAVPSAGCRLSDPVYAFKDVRALEPEEEGMSLLFGTIVVDRSGAGDLASVDLEKIGPGEARTHWNTNNVNMFRVFFRRTMKDGHFLMEVPPGLYEVERFVTGGWGQPETFNVAGEVRKAMRILVTRPGIYDLGSIRVTRSEGWKNYNKYDVERVLDNSPERQAVLRQAIAGTTWERLAAAPPTPTSTPTPPPAPAP
jgi:hypothetical protein